MKKNKTIAFMIQFFLFSSIIVVIYLTFKESNKLSTANISKTSTLSVSRSSRCHNHIKRKCCTVGYCANLDDCPIMPDECNEQNSKPYCFNYYWSNTTVNNLCKDCRIPSMSRKIYQECKE